MTVHLAKEWLDRHEPKHEGAWFASRVRKAAPTVLCLHSTAGSDVNGALQTLYDKGLSYGYVFDKAGDVWKLVPTSCVAFHAGNSYGPREKAAGVSRHQDSSGNFTAKPTPCINDYSFGLSFVNRNDGHDPYTAPQFDAALTIGRELLKAYPSLQWVTTHKIVSPRRKIDPDLFDVDAYAKALGLPVWRY